MISQKQKGMTLIEVVVSMLIIGIGLAGAVAILQTSMRNNAMAVSRNSAIYLSQSIIDKIQMNRVSLSRYLTNSISFKETESCAYCASDVNKQDGFNQATQDMKLWLAELQQKLPGATFNIRVVDSKTHRYAIDINWPVRLDSLFDKNPNDASLTDSLTMAFSL